MRTIQLRLADEYPAEQSHWTSISFRTFSQELFGDLRATLFLISASIGLVLLLACANVANLFLVRAGSRARELAVRSVLGAGRWRIVRQLATETFVVAALAGVLGALLGHALVGFVRQYAAERLPFGGEIALDGRAAWIDSTYGGLFGGTTRKYRRSDASPVRATIRFALTFWRAR